MELADQTIYNLLKEIKSLAAHASLTGALVKGTERLLQMYNKCLTLTVKQDQTAAQLFDELPPTATVDDIGVAAALLASYLKPEPRLHAHDILAFNEDHLGLGEED